MSKITNQEIESAQEKLNHYSPDSKKHIDLTKALSRADAWMRSAKEIRESSTEELEVALETANAWDKLIRSQFKNARSDDVEAAHEMKVKWQRSSILRQYDPKTIQEAVATMERWHRDPRLKSFSPRNLLEFYKAFEKKAPRELARADMLEKQVKKSETLRSKSQGELQRILDFHTYWHDKKRLEKISIPRTCFGLRW